jgi:O-antigen ligase
MNLKKINMSERDIKLLFDKFLFFVIFLILLSPGIMYKDMALIQIPAPSSVRYELWLVNLNFIDIAISITCILLLLYNRIDTKITLILLGLSISSIFGAIVQANNGFESAIFHDGYISSVRLLLILLFFYLFLSSHNILLMVKVFVISFIILCCISISAVAFTGFEGIMGGRINLLGMGVNVSSDALLMVTFFSLWIREREKSTTGTCIIFLGTLFLIFIMIILTGSRRAVLFYFVIIFLFKYFSKNGIDKFYMIVKSSFVLPLTFFALFIFSGVFAESLNLQGLLRLLTIIDKLDSVTNDGRVGMYGGAFQVIHKYPFGLGLSDWAIQQELGKFTVGSHTHNFILQWYLKFGLSLFFIMIPIFLILRSCINNPVLLAIWIPIFFNHMTGYGYWNFKYSFIMGFLIVFSIYYKKLTDENK